MGDIAEEEGLGGNGGCFGIGECYGDIGQCRGEAAVAQEARCVGVEGCDGRPVERETVGIVVGDEQNAVDFVFCHKLSGMWHVGDAGGDGNLFGGIDHADELPAFGGVGEVDDGDGDVGDDFGIVDECIDYGVGSGQKEEEYHHACIGEDGAVFLSQRGEKSGNERGFHRTKGYIGDGEMRCAIATAKAWGRGGRGAVRRIGVGQNRGSSR